jgi:PAS domain S-box-containing protein
MYHLSERFYPTTRSALSWTVLPILFSIIVFIIGLTTTERNLEPTDAIPIFVFAIAYGMSMLASSNRRVGITLNTGLAVTVAAMLSLGRPSAVIVAFGGAVIVELLRLIFYKKLDLLPHTPLQMVVSLAFAGGIHGCAALVAGQVYVYWGGVLPLQDVTEVELARLGSGIAAAYLFMVTITLVSYRVIHLKLPAKTVTEIVLAVSLTEFWALGTSILCAILYKSLSLINFIAILSVLTAGMLFQRLTEVGRRRLEQRVLELGLINSFGQAISTKLSLEELLETLYQEITRLVPAEMFVVALYESSGDMWSFPFVLQGKTRLTWGAKIGTRAMGRFLLQSRRPLLVRGDVPEELRRIGIVEDLYPPIPRCLMCVPLVVGNQVIGTLSLESLTDARAYRQADVELVMSIVPQAAAALNNALLYNRISDMADELAQINQVSSVVSASLNLQETLLSVCKTVQRLLDAPKAAIFLFDEKNTLVMLSESVGFSEDFRALFQSLPIPVEFTTHEEPFVINDVRVDPRGLGWRSLSQVGGFTAMSFIPLRIPERLIGQLAVFYEEIHYFRGAELRLLSTLANQVAIAVANADLYREAEQRALEMEELVDASHALMESFETHHVAQTTVTRLRKALQLSESSLFLWDIEKEAFEHLASTTKIPFNYTLLRKNLLKRVMDEKAPIYLPESAEDKQTLAVLGLSQVLIMPMALRADPTMGVAILGRASLNPFTERDGRFAAALLNQTATALDNARLFRLIDTELEQRIQQLTTIEIVSRKIALLMDRHAVISELISAALMITEADTAAFGLEVSPGLIRFVRKSRFGPESRTLSTIWQGITGRVMRTGHHEIIHNVQDDPDYITVTPGMRSEITVPIRINDKIAGVLDLESTQSQAFTPSHLTFLTTLAEHAAIALNKSQLFSDIQQRNEEMRTILNSTRDGMILIGQQGEIVRANPAAANLLGLDFSKLIGKNVVRAIAKHIRQLDPARRHIHYPFVQLAETIRKLRTDPSQITRLDYTVMLNGVMRAVQETGLPVTDEQGNVIARLHVLRDVTEELELEQFKEHLIETVVHDLRSPLGSVITSLYLIQEAAKDGDQDTIERASVAALSLTNDLVTMVNSILEVRKMQSGKLDLHQFPLPFRQPVIKAIQSVEILAMQNHIRILNLIPDDFPQLMIDPDKVRRVLINLLDNAVKFTPDHGEIRVEATHQPGQAFVTISVVDTGRGIPEEFRDRVFELFVTVPKEISHGRRRGSGIGLTFCRLTVEAHGGKIWVDSGPEGGAAMRFTLPVAAPKEALKELKQSDAAQIEAAR